MLFSADTSPKLSDLMNKVAAKLSEKKFKAFAVQLGLEYECVREIQKENADNITDAFMAVFHEWRVQQKTPYTWGTVVSALSSDILKETQLAQTLSKTFIKS